MRRPGLALAIAFNRAVRTQDEWFDEPDDLERVEKAFGAIEEIDDPLEAAAILAARLARAKGFSEANEVVPVVVEVEVAVPRSRPA